VKEFPATVASDQHKKALLASLVGVSSEWFDYLLYGFAAALLFGKLYFPNSNVAVGLMLSYVTFSLPFFIRPFGGILFAHMGDTIGRRKTLIITLSLIGGATFLIGLLPSYEKWGFWAPCALILLRIIQGLGLGGEWGGAILVATENSSRKSLGFSGSVPQMGVPIGMLLASSALTIIAKFTNEAQFLAWGWRIPFVGSIILTSIGLAIRLSIHETPVFAEAKKSGQLSRMPLVEVLKYQWREVIIAIGLKVVETAPFYIMGTFVLTYVTVALKMPRAVVLNAITWATVACMIMIPIMGRIANKTSRKKLYIGGAIALVLYAFPYFWLLNTRSAVGIAIASILGMGILWTPITATLGTLYSEIFPARVRYTGATLGYQVGAALAGGTAPLIATGLMYAFNGSFIPVAVYFVFTGLVSLLAIMGVKDAASADTPVAVPISSLVVPSEAD
jgi:MFS family permease